MLVRSSVVALAAGLGLGCGSSVPHAGDSSLADVRCETIGNGIGLDARLASVLDVGQEVQLDLGFVDESTVTQTSGGAVWACGPWTVVVDGTAMLGCRRDEGQPEAAELMVHAERMIVVGTLPMPPRIEVAPVVFAAEGDETALGDIVDADCTSP